MNVETANNEHEERACATCPKNQRLNELNCEKQYWKAQHQKARETCNQYKEKISQLEALVRQLKKRLFGRKTEKKHIRSEQKRSGARVTNGSERGRGASEGGKNGHARRDYSHLPQSKEYYRLRAEQKVCPICGKLGRKIKTYEGSEILETRTIVYVRAIKREKYATVCRCPHRIMVAEGPAKLIPKGKIGISIWVELLYGKYGLGIPTNRKLKDFKSRGLSLAAGTIGDGIKSIAGYFEPVYQALEERLSTGDFFQADETRWSVFTTSETKLTFNWYLWVFIGRESVVHVIDPSRSARVIEEHLGIMIQGILVVDRYSAYKSYAKKTSGGVKLAFCRVHVRRDFIEAGIEYPKLKEWADGWVERIGKLYHINNARVEYSPGTREYEELDRELDKELGAMEEQTENELSGKNLHYGKKKALRSLMEHWEGLCVFAHHPGIPMDNNRSERILRNSVVGRKNYYGSCTSWSAQLAAALFSIFETLRLWNKNEREWLTMYLEACAVAGGKAPANVDIYLPWNDQKTDQGDTPKNAVVKEKKKPDIRFTSRTDPKPDMKIESDNAGEIRCRQPADKSELELWNEYIERYHYLGYSPLPGKNLRYFVFAKDELVALLGFNSAAWRVKARDDFIGWDDDARENKLNYVVNNSRFLILPWIRCENLASRILSTASRNLIEDWFNLHGYKPLMLETFVNSERFNGACYKAANWIYVGKTRGRGRFDYFNQAPLPKKYVLLFPLNKKYKILLY
jgi:transposase